MAEFSGGAKPALCGHAVHRKVVTTAMKHAQCEHGAAVTLVGRFAELELTRFRRRCRGERKKEAPNAKNPSTIRAGVSAPDHRVGAHGGARLRSWPVNSRLQPMRSVNGSSRPDSMKVCAATG